MKCGTIKKRIRVSWSSRSGVLKLNVDGAAKGKLGLIGIGGMLLNSKGGVLLMFSKSVGVRESNEAEVSSILETLQVFSALYLCKLIVETGE